MTISERVPPAEVPVLNVTAQMTLLGHDLRAAALDIVGGLRLVSHEGLNHDTRMQLERVRASGETLARLMDEGLSMMLGDDALRIATHPTNVHLAQFIYDADMRWSGRARENGLEFRVAVGADVPQVLALDRIALERVLSNLLSNAMTYSEHGMVELDIDMLPSGALGIAVTDQGPGFSPGAMARLFEYGGRPLGKNQPGQGLGMHITRTMAARLGGTISVENRPEGGACVTLLLPPECWTRPAAAEKAAALPDLSRYKVLVADDCATNRTIIGQMLVQMGAEVEFAEDGLAAIERLDARHFDLALIDIEMPDMLGTEVIRTLRADSCGNAQMPVIAITAHVLRAHHHAIYAAGADAVLTKPLASLESFGQSVAAVLRRRNASADKGATADPLSAACDGLEQLLRAAGPEVGDALLDQLSVDLRSAEHALIAGLAESSIPLVKSSTHVLIALAGAVGARALQAMATRLNTSAHRSETSGFAKLGRETLGHLRRLITFVAEEKLRYGAG